MLLSVWPVRRAFTRLLFLFEGDGSAGDPCVRGEPWTPVSSPRGQAIEGSGCCLKQEVFRSGCPWTSPEEHQDIQMSGPTQILI